MRLVAVILILVCGGVALAQQPMVQSGTWNVRIQDGAGNGLTSNSTTFTAKFAQDMNLLGTLGTAFSTAGKVDVKGADGDVFVRQTTAANLNATVTQQALTKGTQGATGVSTQDLKDAGRTALSFYANNVAAGTSTTETIITLTQSKGTAATSGVTTYTPTSGKKFRITGITVASRGNSVATAASTVFNLRLNTGGVCVVTSTPILFGIQSAVPGTTPFLWDRVLFSIPEGYEITGDGTLSICLTAASTYVTNSPTWSANIVGYEY